MKKLINDVSTVVPDMLDGLIALNPQLSLLQAAQSSCAPMPRPWPRAARSR
ncbi:dihydroxyacetone kinase [Paraburkholderia sp. WSM4174]|nr:hypothetical protein [Paraburkholderia tuberum]